jgi:uncharacterized pyridoxamine 5'-phosphate oxidase family protein
MTAREMQDFINDNPMCFLGTCEREQPHVRVVMTYRADERGIIFITGTQKDMNKQLLENPLGEMCYYNEKKGLQLRLTGRFQQLDDDALKEEIIEKFTFLKPVAEQHGLGAFAVWCLPHGSALLWSYENPSAPKEPFAF